MELEPVQLSLERDDLAPNEIAGRSLPPADRGWQAWSLLAGCAMANICIWGFALSFGVLQDYYTTHEPFSSAPYGIAGIGTTTTGLMYLLMPPYFMIMQKWPVLKFYSIWGSFVLTVAGLVGASFAENVPQLIATQGVLFAFGGNMLVVPTITYLDEWFIQRRGLAIGIMWAGDGVGVVIIPLVLQALLSRYGFRTTLRLAAGGMLLLMLPLMPFLKPRVPIARTAVARPINLKFLRDRAFWILQIFNMIEALGYFLPLNYMPTFAQYLGYTSEFGALTLVVAGLTSVLGCITAGYLVDRLEVTSIVAGISLAATISILTIWGTTTGIASLLVFAAFYGMTAGGYSTCWAGMTALMQIHNPGTDASIVFSFLAAGRGIGSVISGPLSESLIRGAAGLQKGDALAFSSEYGSLIIFSGCTALAGGFAFLFRLVDYV